MLRELPQPHVHPSNAHPIRLFLGYGLHVLYWVLVKKELTLGPDLPMEFSTDSIPKAPSHIPGLQFSQNTLRSSPSQIVSLVDSYSNFKAQPK